MVKFFIAGCCLVLTGCERTNHSDPIELTPHGQAVQTNMKAQIVSPSPRGGALSSDGDRAVLALERYKIGDVNEPEEQSTSAIE